MYQVNPNDELPGDNRGDESLHAGLLIKATATTTTSTSTSRYSRLWRRSLVVGFISLPKKTLSPNGISLPSLKTATAYQAVQSVPDNDDDDGNGDGERFSRTLSTRSHVAIDINSNSEDARTENNEAEQLRIRNRNTVVQIVETKDLDALGRFGGVGAVAAVFESDLVTGINGGREAEVWTADPVQTNGFFYYFLKACNSYTIFVLLISSGLCFSIETIEEGPENGWHDGVAILFAVFLMVGCSSAANFCRARKLEKEKLLKMNTLDLKVVFTTPSEEFSFWEKISDNNCKHEKAG